jgi:hypothetical protein
MTEEIDIPPSVTFNDLLKETVEELIRNRILLAEARSYDKKQLTLVFALYMLGQITENAGHLFAPPISTTVPIESATLGSIAEEKDQCIKKAVAAGWSDHVCNQAYQLGLKVARLEWNAYLFQTVKGKGTPL